MKTLIAAIIIFGLAGAVDAQVPGQQPAAAPATHTGVFVYQRVLAKDAPNNLYHVGDDVCTEGSEHYAPDCARNPTTPDAYDIATLTLDDGRVLHVHGSLAVAARAEAITHGDKGTWNVSYVFEETRQNPFTGHTLQYVSVVFPATINGKGHLVTKQIMFDQQDKFLNASTIEESNGSK